MPRTSTCGDVRTSRCLQSRSTEVPRRTDQRAPAVAPKTIAARRAIAAAQSKRSNHVSHCGSTAPDLDRGGGELGSRIAVDDWADIGPSQGKALVRARARTAAELKKAGAASIRYIADAGGSGRLRWTDKALAPLIRSSSNSNFTGSPTTNSLNVARLTMSLR